MPSIQLLKESLFQIDGVSPAIDVSRISGKLFVVTMGVTRILEQENLEVSMWTSSDGTDWGTKPRAAFPPKSYCGLYSVLLNLSGKPPARYVRVQWKMNRWSKAAASVPLLSAFYLELEESGARLLATPQRRLAEISAVA